MKRKLITFACCLVVGNLGAQIPEVSKALFLSVDVSGSINASEYALQKTGYANAFANPTIKNLFTDPDFSLAVKYSEWSTNAPGSEVGWAILDSPGDSQSFSDALGLLSRSTGIGGNTNIAAGIDYAGDDLADAIGSDFTVESGGDKILDVSGDGRQNEPGDVSVSRDGALADGFTVVNGLAITTDVPTLDDYYEANVQSTNGFTVSAATFGDFEQAISEKIFFEITGGEIPEPTTIGLMGVAGIAAFVLVRRRKQTLSAQT